jgi:hypothetical protein
MQDWVAGLFLETTAPFLSIQSASSPAFWVDVVTSAVFNTLVLMIVLEPKSADHQVRPRLELIARVFPTVLVVTCLASLGGLIFRIPGYLVAVMFAVAGPAAVVESLPLKKAIFRNFELTKNNHFGIFLLGAIGMLVSVVLFAAFTLAWFASVTSAFWFVFGQAFKGFSTVMFITGSAVLYQELRMLHEGAEDSDIAAVFD